MNFLFRQVLRRIVGFKEYGTSVVRFLQPIRILLSNRRMKRLASRIYQLRRYKRLKTYKRFITYITIFVRYWNLQPLIDQIAFELEKTKKHWPVLRTIRELIRRLKPHTYTGYRFVVRGRISSSKRTRKFYITGGRIPISSFTNRMTFALCHAKARIGSFGIKAWSYMSESLE